MSLTPSSWFASLAELGRSGRVADALVPGPSSAEVERRIAAIEAGVARSPEASFSLHGEGSATLVTNDRSYAAGRFTTPSLAELTQQARARASDQPGRVSLAILAGTGGLTDIGALQATAGPGTLFQVASQFNCLEAPGPSIVPVSDYVHDYTQGPRASVSAFPATLLRHYRAPHRAGGHFVQTDERHLNLLDDALGPDASCVRSGYLQASEIPDVERAAALLTDGFDRIKVGLHEDVEVVLGHDWGGPVLGAGRIAQVFTSTIAEGGYGPDDGSAARRDLRVQLLRAAYLGTLLSAIVSGSQTAVLTLIGGGVFGNPHVDIWAAIFWACDQVTAIPGASLAVVVNGRDRVAEEARREVAARGGVFVELASDRIVLHRSA